MCARVRACVRVCVKEKKKNKNDKNEIFKSKVKETKQTPTSKQTINKILTVISLCR